MSATTDSPRVYYNVFALLLLLLVLTVAVTAIDHATLAIVAAITVAITKAVLIALYFMQLRHSAPMVRVFAVAAVVWLAFLLMLTAADYLTRA